MNQVMLQKANPGNQRQVLTVAGFTLAVFVVLAYWGGLPPAAEIPKFIAGVLVLAAMTGIVAGLGWHMLVRPMPFVIAPHNLISPLRRQILGLVLILGATLEMLGGIWDEAWHTRYGIPFGQDFFWRPHILIYIGLGTIVLGAMNAWAALLSQGRGNMVQRFRSDPLVGLLILSGLFMFLALPADPVWHTIYGSDLSAFSIPHVLLTVLIIATFLIGIGLLISFSPRRQWQNISHFTSRDIIPIAGLAFLMLSPMVLLTSDWYILTPSDLAKPGNFVFQRPDWLLPAFVLFMATWVGVLANHLLRSFGAATVVGIAALATRLLSVILVNSPNTNLAPWVLDLPPLIAIDLFYMIRVSRQQSTNWWMGGVAAAIGNLVSLALLNHLLLYPHVRIDNLPGMIMFPTLAALMASWSGQLIGDYIAAQRNTVDNSPNARSAMTVPLWLTPIVLIVTLVATIWFVLTAVPPA